MKRIVLILSCLVLALTVVGCRSGESKAEREHRKALANKEEFIRLLRSTGREGVEEVIRQLESTDFFTMGCDSHHTMEGGLVQHSLEVYRIMKSVAWFRSSESIIVVSFFHDMGKVDKGGWHTWRSVKHLVGWGFDLKPDEYFAIFYHHKLAWKYFRSPLRRALTFADVVSTGWWKIWH